MGIRSRLYVARGEDRDIQLSARAVRGLSDDKLLWVDVQEPTPAELDEVAAAFGFPEPIMGALAAPVEEARLVRAPEAILVTVLSVESDDRDIAPVAVDLVAGRNTIVTVHHQPVSPLDEWETRLRNEAALGTLDAASFMAGLVDTMLGTFRRQVEEIESKVDRLDEIALRGRDPGDFLERVVALRRRAATLRRILVPQRETFGTLSRPDFELHKELGQPWPGLVDRLELTIAGVERARELLVGSSEIYLGRLAQRSGDIMKVLTILSAVLLPAVVLAGVMGMNFKLDFFTDTGHFWLVITAMLALAATILGVARFRRWI
jgi:magnesium transporter